MPRVKQVVARKDYPQHGIKKGDRHYTWSLMTSARSSRTFRQIKPPRPSQLTTSEFLGTVGDMDLELAEMDHDENLPGALSDLAERLRTLADEQTEKHGNLPDNLQYAPSGELLETRADAANGWADEIESVVSELESKIDAIRDMPWHELDEFSHLDPEDADFDEADTPSDDAISDARVLQIEEAAGEAISEVEGSNPGFE